MCVVVVWDAACCSAIAFVFVVAFGVVDVVLCVLCGKVVCGFWVIGAPFRLH